MLIFGAVVGLEPWLHRTLCLFIAINPCDGHGCLQGCTVDDVTGEAVCGCQDGFMLNQDGKNCDGMYTRP